MGDNSSSQADRLDVEGEGQDDHGIAPLQEIDFCTLGMFIIDEIHYLPPKSPVFDIIGGAGSYSALGARLFSPPPLSKSVSWIVDVGSDFPALATAQIKAWESSCLFRSDPSRFTTRGWNGYDNAQNRAFKYTTPKLRLDEHSLTYPLLFSKSFHLICSPSRCIDLVKSILRKRKALQPHADKPLFIWEPVPDLCIPDELLNCTNALPYIDICSPNQSELAGFLGDQTLCLNPDGSVDTAAVEKACEHLLSSMPLQSYAFVVRCGASGCYVAKNGGRGRRPTGARRNRPVRRKGGLTLDMDMEALFVGLLSPDGDIEREQEEVEIDPGIEKWIPAYHSPDPGDYRGSKCCENVMTSEQSVVDPTGGGNSFLGGLSVALSRGKLLEEATIYGSVAASFAIEQVGMPVLGVDEKGRETWNEDVVEERVSKLKERIGVLE